jgi:hypothetical protein
MSKGFWVGSANPSDAKYFNDTVPYASVLEVNQTIPLADRHIGLTVNIATDEYHYENGVADVDLVVKSVDLSGKANLGGYALQKFKAAQGTAGNDVVTVDQMNSALPDNIFFDINWLPALFQPLNDGQYTGINSQYAFNSDLTLGLGANLTAILADSNDYIRGVAVSGKCNLSSVNLSCRHGYSQGYSLNLLIVKYTRVHDALFDTPVQGVVVANLVIPSFSGGARVVNLNYNTANFELDNGSLVEIFEGDMIGIIAVQNGISAGSVSFRAPSLSMRFKRID